MVSVTGLDGLNPTIMLSKITKNLAVVNKESIICGWDLIKKNIKKYKTNFIPITLNIIQFTHFLKVKILLMLKGFILLHQSPLNFPKKNLKI